MFTKPKIWMWKQTELASGVQFSSILGFENKLNNSNSLRRSKTLGKCLGK